MQLISQLKPIFSVHRNQKGSILIETALVLPVLLLLLAGAVEMGRFMLANQKLSSLASSMADMVSQAEDGITENEITQIFAAMNHVSKPFDMNQQGRVILSGAIGTDNQGNRINWQRCEGALIGLMSEIGNEGETQVALPGSLILGEGDMAIIAEAYFHYEPLIFSGFFDAVDLRSSASFRPRFGAMDQITPDGLPQSC
ncbi:MULTISPECIES: TadE/TadG family type IV pilus assembly protein [unclassified Iodidimonas]|jgi:hypothetical protein|uniref:TadE/TadG family type IV pilus assembly protein n=1 Tax=unclassified Iodidimonas TaxID=2626145 RepID=UPI0024821170|nr:MULTISPECIES: TadE/TadG family type IV pilus assembly protein [unclassified Iodidimonas]